MPGTTTPYSSNTNHHIRTRCGCNDFPTKSCRATQVCNSERPNNFYLANIGFPESVYSAETSQERILSDAFSMPD